MKKFVSFCLMLMCCSTWGKEVPEISESISPRISPYLIFSKVAPPTQVYYGEKLKVPLQLYCPSYWPYLGKWPWELFRTPANTNLAYVSGNTLGKYNMEMIFRTDHFQTIQGDVSFCFYKCCYHTPSFSTRVIPHPLSMGVIQQQDATANTNFEFNFKTQKAISYDEENQKAGKPAQGVMSATDLEKLKSLGLSFDTKAFVIKGKPNKRGTYTFSVSAKNAYGVTKATTLTINITANAKDKPVFNPNNIMASATPSKKYSLDLNTLLKTDATFNTSNQLKFALSGNHPQPKWLIINPEKPMLLEGVPNSDLAGQTVEATIIASSNTGGESEPYTITIPIAHDREKRPIINPFEMEQLAGNQFYVDLSSYIQDPANDPSLKIVLDKIEPETPKIKVSALNSKMIEGYIAEKFTGQKYLITLHANTTTGGDSESITIPLQISINKSRTPQFKEDNPMLPIIYPGQSFAHDFVANRDVYPEYEDAPYEIQFADDEHPDWLKLENNKLFSDEVPNEINGDIEVNVVIKNLPGGVSHSIPLSLTIMY